MTTRSRIATLSRRRFSAGVAVDARPFASMRATDASYLIARSILQPQARRPLETVARHNRASIGPV
jgi:hypothetical protein